MGDKQQPESTVPLPPGAKVKPGPGKSDKAAHPAGGPGPSGSAAGRPGR